MTGNLYLIKYSGVDPDIIKKVDAIDSLCFRAADMIKQLLMFARKEKVQMHPFGLTSFIKEVSKLHTASIPENISFHMDVCSDELIIRGDATQLQQVILNLLNNARDAVAYVENPSISLKIEEFTTTPAFIAKHPTMKNGKYAFLTVEDNGTGISESNLEHIFEPFFTTKEVGVGTGLGLSMAYGAIQAHKGIIEASSQPGVFTRFHIYLPLGRC